MSKKFKNKKGKDSNKSAKKSSRHHHKSSSFKGRSKAPPVQDEKSAVKHSNKTPAQKDVIDVRPSDTTFDMDENTAD